MSKTKTYDELTIAEFSAGYASILKLPSLSETERSARLDNFIVLMYLGTQFNWSAVREFHAAVLFEIECGRACWGDSFADLETRLLRNSSRSTSSGAAGRSGSGTPVLFCRDYQNDKCSHGKDHFGTIRNETKWLQHICAKCWTELDRGAVIGPFAGNPFSRPIVVSPLNSVPKANSAERRMILDLSWPSGSSINDAIPDGIYLSQPYSLVYPTIDTIADRVASLGSGCLLFKRDLKRAYRQFPIDPFDYPLLGYQWNNELYFDVVLPMGLKTAAMACQRSTSAVRYMLSQAGCYVVNYLDDFIGVASPDTAPQDYETCGHLLRDLGLQESLAKACPPSTVLTCLGVEVNTVDLTLSVTPDRLHEIETLLLQWISRRSATKSELQSLVGKLSFVSKCVRQSRLFLSRILALLRTLKHNHYHTKLSREFHRDIKWWLRFLRTYNGVSVIPSTLWSAPDGVFSTDACLTGCGGLTDQHFFHRVLPEEINVKFHSIHHLEAIAILIACRLWGSSWSGLRIIVQCDNEAVVSSLNSGRVQDPYLAICLRAIWLEAASHEFELRALHLSSSANRLADLLSRWHLQSSFKEQFHAATKSLTLHEVDVSPLLFSLSDDL